MNKLKISLCAIAALALGACTNDEIVPSSEAPVTGDGGDGYISFAINMPTTNASRANDVYDEGLAAEYNVNDITLYLFGGADEASAVCYASYGLSNTGWDTASKGSNITTKKQYTQQITKPSSGNLYALVVINGAGGPSISTSTSSATTFASLQNDDISMDVATIANVTGGTDGLGNFYMTNAPLWHGISGGYTNPANGTTKEVTTLAYIDNAKIYDTQAEAEANSATEIYVERGVAKVTVDGTIASSGMTNITVSVDGFCLDLTNLTGYPVRNTQTGDSWWRYANTGASGGEYRMVGNTEVGVDLYRTYWATDPNYNSNMYTDGTSGNRTYPLTVNSLGGTIPTVLTTADGVTGAYCLENTMSVAHMNQDETTRAIVAVTLTVPHADTDGSFYTFDGNKSVLYTKTEICNEVLALFAANSQIQNAIAESWQGGEFVFSTYYTATIETTSGSSDALVSVTYNSNSFDENDFKDGEIPTILTSFTSIVAEINAAHEFSYYAGGVAYYPVMIKHFGDDLTPWTNDGSGASYPDDGNGSAENNWLGRYGVLRNNWYDITVTSVNSIGSADVPTAYGEPDDPVESWISIEINILSWAKRTQDVTL